MSSTGGPVFSGPSLEISVAKRNGMTIVRATGEIDVASAPTLAGHLQAAITNDATGFVVDLTGVRLIDSTGLSVLLAHREQLQQQSNAIEPCLIISEPQVLKVFSVTGLDRVFSIVPNEAAVAALAD